MIRQKKSDCKKIFVGGDGGDGEDGGDDDDDENQVKVVTL
jgi:hypothetical protein